MQKKILGKTGWSVSTISFGAIKLPRISLKECQTLPDVFRYESYYRQYGLKDWAQEQYRVLTPGAQACSDCQTCLDRCPYGVSIPSNLKKAHNLLTSP